MHPLQPRNKVPILGQWQDRATADESSIRLWSQLHKDCNWGIATGEDSGIVVVDVDPKNGGDISWNRLLAQHGQVDTVSVKTGSGGMHFYFLYPLNHTIGNSSGKLGKGIDIRGNNGQVVAPGSIHPNGERYEWINSLFTHDMQPMPEWMLEALEDSTDVDFSPLGETVEKGTRNNSMYHAALALARQGVQREFAISSIKKWMIEQGHKDIDEDEMLTTIDSAYKSAKKKPMSEILEKSDTFNAEMLINSYGDDLAYVPGMGWFYWNGKFWEPDPESAIVSQLFIRCMKALRDDASGRFATVSNKNEAKELGQVQLWAIRSMSASAVHAAVSLAMTFPQVRKKPEDMDPVDTLWKLNCNNGTVDLRTKQITPHNKKDMITKMVPINYVPGKPCDFWKSTFDLIFDGNNDLTLFMQKALGYSITGSNDERCFFICWGEAGANGKSTVLETVQDILGVGYAQMSDMVVITSSTVDNRVSSSLAKLQGARFVSMNEAEEHQRLSEALIKQLTGGDTVQACFKYKNPFEYKPVFKLWIRTNEKPIIRSQTDAIWGRVKLIPFERSIPVEKRLPRSEVDAHLTAEREGILAWLIEGAYLWLQDKHLKDPTQVTAAVQGYRTDSDTIRQFMDECCEVSPQGRCKSSEAYQVYVMWMKDSGEKYFMTRTKFVQRLARATGCPVARSGGSTYITGIKLNQTGTMYM